MDPKYTLQWIKDRGELLDGFINTSCSNNGFGVSPGEDANTTGIRLYERIFVINNPNIRGGKMGVLLMDTQGLWDSTTANNFNHIIIGLSCMLSSYLVLNNKGIITSQFLENIANPIDFIHGLIDISKPFQQMDILIRDCPDFDIHNNTIQEYLSISDNLKRTLLTDQSFKIPMNRINSHFKSFNTSCLPYPGRIDSLGYDGNMNAIDESFLLFMGYYIEEIFLKGEPLMVDNRMVNGELFIKYDFILYFKIIF